MMINKVEICNELMKILEKINEEHPCLYSKVAKEEVSSEIKEILNIDDPDIIKYAISKIFAKIGDPHTTIEFAGFSSAIPILFRKIKDVVYVRKSNINFEDDMYGNKLVSINGVSINNIIEEISNIIPSNTSEWLNVQIQNALSKMGVLKLLPCMKNTNKFTYEFENGTQLDFNLNEEYAEQIKPIIPYNYSWEYDKDNNLIRVNYQRCYSNEKYTFDKLVADIDNFSKSYGINDFVVDLRGNEGGNSRVIDPLIEYLKGKNLITLIDGEVFSSGSLALFKLINIGSKTIGSKIGTPINNFGETKKIDITYYPNLEQLGSVIRYSTKYFYTDQSGIPGSIEGKANYEIFMSRPENAYLINPILFVPDIELDYTGNDIGGNELYEKAKSEFEKNKIVR